VDRGFKENSGGKATVEAKTLAGEVYKRARQKVRQGLRKKGSLEPGVTVRMVGG